MPGEPTRPDPGTAATRRLAWIALAGIVLGTFLMWASDGFVRLDGTQGPNNGWLIVIVSAFAIGWARSMTRGSWTGVAGVFGSSLVIGLTAAENWVDNRDVLGASAGYGLLLVIAGSVALGGTAVERAVRLARVARSSGAR